MKQRGRRAWSHFLVARLGAKGLLPPYLPSLPSQLFEFEYNARTSCNGQNEASVLIIHISGPV